MPAPTLDFDPRMFGLVCAIVAVGIALKWRSITRKPVVLVNGDSTRVGNLVLSSSEFSSAARMHRADGSKSQEMIELVHPNLGRLEGAIGNDLEAVARAFPMNVDVFEINVPLAGKGRSRVELHKDGVVIHHSHGRRLLPLFDLTMSRDPDDAKQVALAIGVPSREILTLTFGNTALAEVFLERVQQRRETPSPLAREQLEVLASATDVLGQLRDRERRGYREGALSMADLAILASHPDASPKIRIAAAQVVAESGNEAAKAVALEMKQSLFEELRECSEEIEATRRRAAGR